jgi:single-strand DNA-binding protein
MNLNVVTITGNLTKTPELRATPSGAEVCTMRVAVNERVKQNDEWSDRANFFDVTCFGKTAENAALYLAKGSGVAVSGRLRWREYEHDGIKRQAVEIVANTVQFLGARDVKKLDAFDDAKAFVGVEDDMDDLPF